MSSKTKRPTLNPIEKIEAIRRVHDGESKASVARDIGVPESTLRGWCKNEDKILFLSRQSSPESYECEPETKKAKYSRESAPPATGLNLSVTMPPSVASTSANINTISSFNNTPPTVTTKAGPSSAERVKKPTEFSQNRAELHRLNASLGLDRPEYTSLMSTLLSGLPFNQFQGNTAFGSYESFSEMAARIWQQVNQNAATPVAKNSNCSNGKTTIKNTMNADSNTSRHSALRENSSIFQPPRNTDEAVRQWMKLQQETVAISKAHSYLSTQPSMTHSFSQPISSSHYTKYPQVPNTTKAVIPNNSAISNPVTVQQNEQYIPAPSATVEPNTAVSPATVCDDNVPINLSQMNIQPPASWFWSWYKDSYPNGLDSSNGYSTVDDSILFNQLTKNNLLTTSTASTPTTSPVTDTEQPVIATNGTSKPKKKWLPQKPAQRNLEEVHAMLDKLLVPKNTPVCDQSEVKENDNGVPKGLEEGLECGLKFIKWLENYFDPAVTAKEVVHLKFLLSKIRHNSEIKKKPRQSRIRKRKFRYSIESSLED